MADLTDSASVKEALEIGGSGDDALIGSLLTEVTSLIEHLTRRRFTNGTYTWITQARSTGVRTISLAAYPECTITSVHCSTTMPRTYDATTLLDVDSYIVDPDNGVLHRLTQDWPTDPQSIKVVYDGGYTTIPDDLQRACIEVVAVKLSKGKSQLYHFESEEVGEGQLQGIRNTDIPTSAMKVINSYRSWL